MGKKGRGRPKISKKWFSTKKRKEAVNPTKKQPAEQGDGPIDAAYVFSEDGMPEEIIVSLDQMIDDDDFDVGEEDESSGPQRHDSIGDNTSVFASYERSNSGRDEVSVVGNRKVIV